MKLTVTLKPRIVTAQTKNALVSKIKGNHVWTYSRQGGFLAPYPVVRAEYSHARVYNLEKRRRRVKRSIVKGVKITEAVRGNHWIGYVYDIPVAVLTTLNLKVIQDNRTFRFQKA